VIYLTLSSARNRTTTSVQSNRPDGFYLCASDLIANVIQAGQAIG
jgi:hypothetical protein